MLVMSAQLKRFCLHEEVKEMAENPVDKCESTGGIDRRSTVDTSTIQNVKIDSFVDNGIVADGVKT
jgi:hypothetical protein